MKWQRTRGVLQELSQMSEYAPTSFAMSCFVFLSKSITFLTAEKSMCARHDGIVNSRHTDLHCRNVSWWLRMVAVCENCTSSSSQTVKDAKEISQGDIKLFQHYHVWKRCASLYPPFPLHLTQTHTPNMKKPGEWGRGERARVSVCACVCGGVFSVLSLQSCQCEGKWLFNILHQPPKWWEGGDVRVTTAAVY